MNDKPSCWDEKYATAFQEASVAEAYQYRPPYPAAAFEILNTLITDTPRRVLDAGCGTGALARHLTSIADEIDAIDFSSAMIERGKQLPHGDNPRIRWIKGRIEQVSLHPPYALITAGESLHWMEWDVVLPRLQSLLSRHGLLVILELQTPPVPWSDGLVSLIQRFSTMRDYQKVDLVAELERRGLFEVQGRRQTEATPFVQSLDAYIESFHGRASFSRERMSKAEAATFDQALRDLVAPHSPQSVTLPLIVDIIWGKPLQPPTETM
jgi:ubiquinone/menaquinone biosynthesis C-methylase UbiE